MSDLVFSLSQGIIAGLSVALIAAGETAWTALTIGCIVFNLFLHTSR